MNDFRYVDDIGPHTRRCDNTDEERRKAALALARNAHGTGELLDWLDMLGIKPEWIDGSTPQPDREPGRAMPRSDKQRRAMRSWGRVVGPDDV